MFLALMLSAMAIGSASANDVERRPAGFMFGMGGDDGFVVVNVVAPRAPHHPAEFRGGCDCDKKHRKGDKRGDKCNGKRADKKVKRDDKPHHPSMHRPAPHHVAPHHVAPHHVGLHHVAPHHPMPHRPGMPVPPSPRR